MSIKITVGLIIAIISYQSQSIELEGDISDYVQEACDNELSSYCASTPQLKKYLTIYAGNIEGYMQANDNDKVKLFYLKHYAAGLCIEQLYPNPNDHKEITARMGAYLLYSKERFSLYNKSQMKAYKANVHKVITSKDYIPEDCLTMI
jgi:hypothetical protein